MATLIDDQCQSTIKQEVRSNSRSFFKKIKRKIHYNFYYNMIKITTTMNIQIYNNQEGWNSGIIKFIRTNSTNQEMMEIPIHLTSVPQALYQTHKMPSIQQTNDMKK